MNAKIYKERGALDTCIDIVARNTDKDKEKMQAVSACLVEHFDGEVIISDGDTNLIVCIPCDNVLQAKEIYSEAKKLVNTKVMQ